MFYFSSHPTSSRLSIDETSAICMKRLSLDASSNVSKRTCKSSPDKRASPYTNPFCYVHNNEGSRYVARPFPKEVGSLSKIKHQRCKDHRALIRAAKLKVHYNKYTVKDKTNEGVQLPDSDANTVNKTSKTFAAGAIMTDFKSLASCNNAKSSCKIVTENKEGTSVNDKEDSLFRGESFNDIQTSTKNISNSNSALSMSSLESSLPNVLPSCVSDRQRTPPDAVRTCSQQALMDDMTVDELAGYLEDFVHLPKKMSSMAEMMYT